MLYSCSIIIVNHPVHIILYNLLRTRMSLIKIKIYSHTYSFRGHLLSVDYNIPICIEVYIYWKINSLIKFKRNMQM